MSAVRFQCPSYKLFEPDYHPQRPIIVGVDDRLESPETLTLRYEEAARAAEGGDPRGESSPRLLDMTAFGKAQLPPMPAMHGYDSTRYQDASYEQYQAQPFTGQEAGKFAQLNQQSFAANNAVAQYISSGPTVLSYHPTSGVFGTKIFLRVSSPYDLVSMNSPIPYVSVFFGSQKCPVPDLAREGQEDDAFIYSCSADVPQLMVTGCNNSDVPLVLVIEGPSGEEISRTVVGSFQYLEESAGGEITRTAKVPKHDTGAPGQDVDQASGTSPKTAGDEPHAAHPAAGSAVSSLGPDPATNTYDYPSQQGQYAPAAFPQDTSNNGDMITTAYRSSSFTDPSYHHRRSAPGWNTFSGAPLGSSMGRSPALGHHHSSHHHHYGHGAGRTSLTPLQMTSSNSMSALGCESGTPTLVRTSTMSGSANVGGGFHPMSLYPNKASLKINGKLDSMTQDWNQDEWESRRRIVMFRKTQSGSTLTANFRAVEPNQRPPNSICVSCIYWRERGGFYVTSVDTIHLLEQLVAMPNRFTVEEKNRIRRNLEGFHPVTVAKGRNDSEEFFKVIMGFPNPKPRNIEKDVKVFKWSDLEPALKKIIGKYSASPSSTVPPPGAAMMTAVSSAGPYAPLPTPPGQGLSSHHGGDPHSQYSMHASHSGHDPIPSPRSLSGSQPAWTPYTTGPTYPGLSTRALSPGMRNPSPHQPPPMRINTTPLPAVTTYDTRTVTTGGGYGSAASAGTGLHTPINHHPSTATPPRWDPTGPASYPDGYPSLSTHHGPGHAQPVYGSGPYGDGAPRA